MMPSQPAKRPAIKAPTNKLKTMEMKDQTPTAMPAPLTGSSEVGSIIANPRLVPKVDKRIDIANTVTMPAMMLPHDMVLIVLVSGMPL